MSTGSQANIAHLAGKLTIHTGDIRDAALVNELVEQSDIVFHLAAALGVKNIMDHTIESIDRNLTGSEVVLNAATKHSKPTYQPPPVLAFRGWVSRRLGVTGFILVLISVRLTTRLR
jgi:nucleoside-diphosphate-sugar epimerase